jgi:iron complex transport system substrate-binding protein
MTMSPAARAERIVSLNLCTDQLLVLLAPESIVALSPLARDPSLSFVAAQAKKYPWVRADAEAVLALHPDFVIAEQYGAQTTIAMLRARGVSVVQFDEPQDFDAIANQVRAVSGLLGQPARGEALVADMQARLAALPPRAQPQTAILWQARGYSAGPGSLGDAVLRAAGLQDAGTGGAIGVERLAAHRPDLLITETAPRFPSLSSDILFHPAVAAIPRRVVAPALLTCGGPFTVQAAEALAR